MKESNTIPANKRIFPEETNNGKISIENNTIRCTGNDDIHTYEIDIIDIQYVYVIVTPEKRSFLFIFDNKENWLPANYNGFSKVYNELSAEFGFNDNIFFTYTTRNIPVQKQLWRKMHEPTYRILERYYHDYGSGFEVQSPERELINWDTTIENLKTNPNVFFEESVNDCQSVKFKYPVRIGNILLINFHGLFYGGRTDIPPLKFYAECFDKSNSDKSFTELKKRLKKDFLEKTKTMLCERSDQKVYCFEIKGMQFSICYTYDSKNQFDSECTLFSVNNEREYPEPFIIAEYEKVFEVSNFITIDEDIKTMSHYTINKHIMLRPENLLPDNQLTPAIWIDNKNSVIGFADRSFCHVLNISEIVSIRIQNVLPAKGGGYSCLELNIQGESVNYEVFTGACYVFDLYKKNIEKLTGLEVIMAPEYHNC